MWRSSSRFRRPRRVQCSMLMLFIGYQPITLFVVISHQRAQRLQFSGLSSNRARNPRVHPSRTLCIQKLKRRCGTKVSVDYVLHCLLYRSGHYYRAGPRRPGAREAKESIFLGRLSVLKHTPIALSFCDRALRPRRSVVNWIWRLLSIRGLFIHPHVTATVKSIEVEISSVGRRHGQ